ncbi:MAG: hypothetical protein JXR37_14450 [Kiritimatiellae bacterium]|nr:hypothetical protein [Kiritimatiellia bacterium]
MRAAWPNVHIWVFRGPAEENLAAFFDEVDVRVIRNRPLAEVCGLIASCGQFVGNDPGLPHVAYACGLIAIGLFDATDSRHTGPLCCEPIKGADNRLAGINVHTLFERLGRQRHGDGAAQPALTT